MGRSMVRPVPSPVTAAVMSLSALLPLLPLLALVALLGAPSRAEAQTSQQRAEARQLFEDGLEAVGNEAYADAIGHFQRSIALVPRASTATNLALALRSTGDVLGARRVLEGLIAGDYGEVPEAQRARLQRELDAVARESAHLTVHIEGGRDIQVTIDGEPVGRLEEPGHLEVSVNPGTRVIAATALDHQPTRQEVEVATGGDAEVRLAMLPADDDRPGTLVLESSDPSAIVEIEGVAEATGRLERRLPAGEYTVRVIGSDGTDESRVVVPPGRRIRLLLEPPEVSFFQRPAVWAVIGVVIAGGIAVAIWALSNRTQDPIVDPVWGNPTALAW